MNWTVSGQRSHDRECFCQVPSDRTRDYFKQHDMELNERIGQAICWCHGEDGTENLSWRGKEKLEAWRAKQIGASVGE